MKFLTRLCCVLSVMSLSVISAGNCFAAYRDGYKLYDNYTLLSEEEKADNPIPTDELYDYTLKYQTGTRARGMQVNLWYMRALGDSVPGGGKKLNIVRDDNSGGGKLRLYKNSTLMGSYDIAPELNSFAAMQNYKLLFKASGENGGYDAQVLLVADSEVNSVSPDKKTAINAEKFFHISDVTVGNGITLSENSRVQYYIEAEKAGYYRIEIKKSSNVLAYLNISVNDKTVDYDVNSSCADVWLDAGLNTVSISCQRNSASFKELDVTPYICKYRFDETSKYIYISGTATPKADVSAVLTEDAAITPSAIRNITQTVADSDGNFSAEFMLIGDLEQLVLSLNAGGIFWKLEDAEHFESGILASGVLTLERKDGKVLAGAEVNNTLRGNYDKCHIIIAFYDSEKRLLDVKRSENYAKSFSSDMPEGAAYANAYLWEDIGEMIPFANSAQVDFEKGK